MGKLTRDASLYSPHARFDIVAKCNAKAVLSPLIRPYSLQGFRNLTRTTDCRCCGRTQRWGRHSISYSFKCHSRLAGSRCFANGTCVRVFLIEQNLLRAAWMLCLFAGSICWAGANAAETIKARTVLPIEIMGPEGTVAAVTVEIPSTAAGEVSSLWLQVNGLEYEDLASVRVNDGAWVSMNNATAHVVQPGRNYGGIGECFATLKMTVPIASGSVVEGANRIAFRFNRPPKAFSWGQFSTGDISDRE